MSVFNKSLIDGQDLFARSATPFAPRGASSEAPYNNVPATATRTNVLSSTSGGNAVMPIVNNRYSTYKKIVSVIEMYEYYSLTEKILELIKDYINRTIDRDAKILTCKSSDENDIANVDRLNNIFESLGFKELLKSEMDKINYYGSTAYAISYNKITDNSGNTINKYRLSKLKSPHDVISVQCGNSRYYLISKGEQTSSGYNKISANSIGSIPGINTTELMPDTKIMYLGSLDMELKHDEDSKKVLNHHLKLNDKSNESSKYNVEAYKSALINSHKPNDGVIPSTELNSTTPVVSNEAFNLNDKIQYTIHSGIVSYPYNLRASKPLYYSVYQTVKDYFIKDIILYVLGVKSSVQPLVLTWGVDSTYNYTVDELMNMITTMESRLNKLVDIDLINSANMDMDILVNRILGNIRIIPDLGNNIRALDEKELDALSRKIQELTQTRIQTKDDILDSIGIPKDLFEGATNREEVLKRDERFQSLVLKFITKLKDSVVHAALTFARLEGMNITKDSFDVSLFRKSSVEYTLNTAKLESVREFTSMLLTVMSDVQQLTQTGMVDRDNLYNVIRKQFNTVGDDLSSVLLSELPTQQQQEE